MGAQTLSIRGDLSCPTASALLLHLDSPILSGRPLSHTTSVALVLRSWNSHALLCDFISSHREASWIACPPTLGSALGCVSASKMSGSGCDVTEGLKTTCSFGLALVPLLIASEHDCSRVIEGG